MKRLLLLIAIIFTGYTSSYASHLMGAEITYTHVSGNDYEVTLIIYRDCSGISVSTFQTVTFQSASCGQNFGFPIPFIQTIDVSQVCPGQTTTCTGGTVPGTQQYVFRGTVTLTPCSDWIMHWNSGTRNPAITNLVSPSSENLYIQNTLDNIVGANNNSPQFFNIPTPYLCVNQLAIYSHAASDVDGDSLYYSFNQPLGTPGPPGTPIAFTGGYSLLQPMITAAGMNLDQQTGEMCFTPSQAQISVVSVLISEFRNGVLIGSQIREMQVIVSTVCTNQNPTTGAVATCGGSGGMTITVAGPSVDSVDQNSIRMCPNDFVCLEITFSDPDPGQNITVLDNIAASIPGATWTVVNNNTPNPIGTFCWTPTPLDSGLNVFSLILNDDACPISGTQTFTYDIFVFDEPYAGPDDTICINQGAQLNASGGATYTWFDPLTNIQIPVGPNFTCNPCFNPIVTLPLGTTSFYVLSSLTAACENTDTVSITVIPDFLTPPIITDTNYCEGLSVNIEVIDSFATYQWIPTGGNTYIGNFNGPDTVAVIVSDGVCADTSNFIIITEYQKPHPEILGELIICSDDSTTLSFSSVYSNPLWNNGSTADSITIAANVGNVTLTVDSAGCSETVIATILSKPVPSTFIIGVQTICPGATINLSTSGGPFDSYLWSPTNSTSSTTIASSGPISVTVVQNGCDFTASNTINSFPAPIADFTISPEASGEPSIDIIFTDASTGASSWIWDFDVTNIGENVGTNPSDATGSGPITVVYDNQGTYTISLTVTDVNGCVNTISKEYLVFSELIIPNVITPNGDNMNDFFKIKNLDPSLFPNQLTVLNRWGRKVFEQSNYDNKWDGGSLKEGTYFYVLQVDFNDGQQIFQGTLILLRK